ncbi:uncharacterized protein LOC124995857 isoform X2 [Mugil cephalus]|uniref:uncharacterized protein LOC124995857 isoform X2 n=1 Tax=Mugil cephalus TaxID=48193 RepID=UPI001FB5C816|nr:uncharacterized protein LOC124995857 isoform X2 [Mugil cephalus]
MALHPWGRCVAAAANRMSCSCCCCVTPSEQLLHGKQKKEEEEEEEAEEVESRRNMDISMLREQYRSSRDRQRTHTQVLLLREVSVELSDAVNVVPVSQRLVSPPAVTFEPELLTYDPWHVHLDLHRRSCPPLSVQLPSSSSDTTSSGCSWSSSSEDEARKQCEDSVSLSSSKETSFSGSKDPVFRSAENSVPTSSDSVDGIQVSFPDFRTSRKSSVCSSFADSQEPSDESSTPVASVASSTTNNRHQDPEEPEKTSGVLQTSRKSSAPSLRFTRQLSVGGAASFSSSHYPFPSRRNPRISEAAKRLGMYASF